MKAKSLTSQDNCSAVICSKLEEVSQLSVIIKRSNLVDWDARSPLVDEFGLDATASVNYTTQTRKVERLDALSISAKSNDSANITNCWI